MFLKGFYLYGYSMNLLSKKLNHRKKKIINLFPNDHSETDFLMKKN